MDMPALVTSASSTEPMRLLEQGLDILAFLNSCNEASIADVARGCGLPRTTALRYLESLRLSGYLIRVGHKKRYRLTIKVRSLSSGFDDELWISDIARPHIRALGESVVWPILLAMPHGSIMQVRENTDHYSPLALVRHATGTPIPIEESASGLTYLANCTPQTRRLVLEMIALHPYAPERWDGGADMAHRLPEVERDGYALYVRKIHHEGGLSVAIMDGERFLASLTLRFIYGAVTTASIVDNYLEPLRQTAAKIGAEYSAKRRSVDPWAAQRQ